MPVAICIMPITLTGLPNTHRSSLSLKQIIQQPLRRQQQQQPTANNRQPTTDNNIITTYVNYQRFPAGTPPPPPLPPFLFFFFSFLFFLGGFGRGWGVGVGVRGWGGGGGLRLRRGCGSLSGGLRWGRRSGRIWKQKCRWNLHVDLHRIECL